MLFELLAGLTAFLVARDRKESLTEMAVSAGISGLVIGLIIGVLAIFLLSPVIGTIYSIAGIEIPLTIADMLSQMQVFSIATLFLSIVYSAITSAIMALVSVALYALNKEIMKRMEL